MCTACTVTTTKASDLFEIVSLEYEAALVHLAVDLVVAVDPANTLDLAAHLEGDRRALDLQVLDQHHGIAVRQKLTVGVADDGFGVVVLGAGFCNRSFVAAVSANIVVAIRVGVGQGALGTGRVDVGHGVCVRQAGVGEPCTVWQIIGLTGACAAPYLRLYRCHE
jgi:hypothetical protein